MNTEVHMRSKKKKGQKSKRNIENDYNNTILLVFTTGIMRKRTYTGWMIYCNKHN